MDDSTKSSHLSRVRGKMDRMEEDARLLRRHRPELYEQLRDAVVEDELHSREGLDEMRERVTEARSTLGDYLLDEETDGQQPIELYRCTECGKLSVSLGYLHGHMEKHNGIGPWNLIPDPRKTANPDALMEMTEVIQVTDYEIVEEPEHV